MSEHPHIHLVECTSLDSLLSRTYVLGLSVKFSDLTDEEKEIAYNSALNMRDESDRRHRKYIDTLETAIRQLIQVDELPEEAKRILEEVNPDVEDWDDDYDEEV